MEHDDDDNLPDPLDSLLEEAGQQVGFTPTPFGPVSMPVGSEDPIPEANEENMICLRGPCKHYVEIVKRFHAGNRDMGPGFDPRQIMRFCDAMKQTTDLVDETIHDCNRWEPQSYVEIARLTQARETYKNKKEKEKENGSGTEGSEA